MSVALPGFILNDRLVRRKRYLQFFSDLCARMPMLMFDGGESIFEIIRRESTDRFLFLSGIGRDLINDKNALSALFKENGIEESDLEDLSNFFLGLGVGEIKLQKQHCELYRNCFSIKLKEADEVLQNRGRIYKSLFVSLSLVVFIILI